MDDNFCSVCREPIKPPVGYIPCCSHRFCFECIHNCSRYDNRCPLDRKYFDSIVSVKGLDQIIVFSGYPPVGRLQYTDLRIYKLGLPIRIESASGTRCSNLRITPQKIQSEIGHFTSQLESLINHDPMTYTFDSTSSKLLCKTTHCLSRLWSLVNSYEELHGKKPEVTTTMQAHLSVVGIYLSNLYEKMEMHSIFKYMPTVGNYKTLEVLRSDIESFLGHFNCDE